MMLSEKLKQPNIKKFLTYLGTLLAIVCVSLLFVNLFKHWASLPELGFNAKVLRLSLYVVLLLNLAFALQAFNWQLLVKGAGGSISYRTSYELNGVSQIGKYLPGNVFHYVGRVLLGKNNGVDPSSAVALTFVEIFLIIASGSLIALAGLFYFDSQRTWFGPFLAEHQLILIAIITVLGATGLIFFSPIKRWAKQNRRAFTPRLFPALITLYMIDFVMLGLAFKCCLTIFDVTAPTPLINLTWGFTIAWVCGFVVPGAPGGIGVREFILLAIFGNTFGAGPTSAALIFMRLLNVSVDFMVFCIASFLAKKTPSQH